MVGRACGLPVVNGQQQGVRPGTYCEPRMTSVGSQDTTGPMTRDELKDLACLGFSADLVMQSFCHTAAYPKPVDVKMHHELPDFISHRGGIALRPGDGVIHSWLNRLLLPDTVGTGGDSHTRFPIGISFPAGSGLVAFGAATGVGLAASPLVTLREVIATRDASSLPAALCFFVTLQCGLWTAYGVVKRDWSTAANNAVGAALGVVQLALIAACPRRRAVVGEAKRLEDGDGAAAAATAALVPAAAAPGVGTPRPPEP
jgi:hypothetical protein